MIDVVKLDRICMEIASVFQRISCGEIDLMDNRNVRIIGPGRVANEIGTAVNDIGFKAMLGQDVTRDEVRGLIDKLATIRDTFEVEELAPLILGLESLCKTDI